jgi:3-hydroxyisobutyrate dehydrogenase-like beta-hydroxyacid dehydrogenase
MSTAPVIGILGLGEAGSAFAADLGERTRVTGYDPLWSGTPQGFRVAANAAEAVADADLILALTAAPDAAGALDSVLGQAPHGTLYADLSSSSPVLKAQLADTAAASGYLFADAVLLAPVLRARSATPMMASGPGAAAFAAMLSPLGAEITALGERAGEAAAHKLLRSIVVKGLTALLVESLHAAEDQGLLEWFSDHIVTTLSELDADSVAKLLVGTLSHSARRVHEMEATVEMIEAAGGDATMTRATVGVLTSVSAETGIPRGKALR